MPRGTGLVPLDKLVVPAELDGHAGIAAPPRRREKPPDLARRPPTRPADLCGSLDGLLTEAIKERRGGR